MRVELKDVYKRFGDVPALAGVSLTIESGERVALVGPNGSGKSTLVRAVMGIVSCRGEVRLGDEDPFCHRARLASRLAYVPQTAPLLGATVEELTRAVTCLRGLDRDAIHSVAEEIDLDLSGLRRRPLRTLSGGTKQKLMITLALASPVSLLIMDEPTASLDAETRQAVFRLFERRARDTTLLLSSHRLDEVRRLVDRVVAIEEGRKVLDAPVTAREVAELLNGGTYRPTPEQRLACAGGS